MKRYIAAAGTAAVAAATVAATAGAVPIGSQNACGVGNVPVGGQAACRFIDAGTVGVAGFSDTGWAITHKETVADCVNKVTVITTNSVKDAGADGSGQIGSQPKLTKGVTYTLSIKGNGLAFAGAPGTTPATPADKEPADIAVDKTGGKISGAPC